MFIDAASAQLFRTKLCRKSSAASAIVAAAGFSLFMPAASAESNTYIVASQVMTISTSEASEGSAALAIGGTRLRAIGGTRLRAEESEELQAIGGTFLRAIGGTRLRNADGSSDQLAIGGTRLRSDEESASQAIGGTRLRAIGGTRLRSDDSSELVAIGGTRLRAIGGTRLRAIGGTRLRAADETQSVQAIGGTRLRAIESDSSVEAIGGTRLRAIGGTRLRAIGGTRLRADGEANGAVASDSAQLSTAAASISAPVALLLGPGDSVDLFAYGPITAVSEDQLQVSVVGQPVELPEGLAIGAAQLGQVALVAGSTGSQASVIVLSDEWHVPGVTNVSVVARVIGTDETTATFTLEGGVVVDYSNMLAKDAAFGVTVGNQVLVSGSAY